MGPGSGRDPARRCWRFSFYPLFKAFTLGQLQVAINALLILALGLWIRGRRGLAGAAIGVCALLKPTYALVLLWGMLRRQSSFVLAASCVVAVGLAAAIAVFGWRNHLDYLQVLAYLGRHGEGYYPNQSVNGLVNRLLANGNNLEWAPHSFSPFHPAVYAATVASSIVILGLALLAPMHTRRAAPPVTDLAIMMLSTTIASPIAWEHHYGFTIALYAIALDLVLAGDARPRAAWLALLAGSFLLASHFSGPPEPGTRLHAMEPAPVLPASGRARAARDLVQTRPFGRRRRRGRLRERGPGRCTSRLSSVRSKRESGRPIL